MHFNRQFKNRNNFPIGYKIVKNEYINYDAVVKKCSFPFQNCTIFSVVDTYFYSFQRLIGFHKWIVSTWFTNFQTFSFKGWIENTSINPKYLRAIIFQSADAAPLILLFCLGDAMRYAVSADLKMATRIAPWLIHSNIYLL